MERSCATLRHFRGFRGSLVFNAFTVVEAVNRSRIVCSFAVEMKGVEAS